jgi:selenocysteine lyase/cysteine desulfurase
MDYPSAARETLAACFQAAPPEHFIFTQNATDALNMLIHGFVKKTGAPFHGGHDRTRTQFGAPPVNDA